jgi:hypothetical protein
MIVTESPIVDGVFTEYQTILLNKQVNFDNGKKKYILLNKHQCTQTWNFKFLIN